MALGPQRRKGEDNVAEVYCLNDTLTVHLTGRDRELAGRARLDIPLDEIRGVESGRRIARGVVMDAGEAFFRDGNRIFWDVRNPKKAIEIALDDETFSRLVIDVRDPNAVVNEIREALRARTDGKLKAA
jgi:hypothetical protein